MKRARLVRRGTTIALLPAFTRRGQRPYGIDSEAQCEVLRWRPRQRARTHLVPEMACSCGFHAVEGLKDLGRLAPDTPDRVTLDVDCFGRVIEHEHGVRAQRQRVARVTVPGCCARCGQAASLFGGRRRIVGLCQQHSSGWRRWLARPMTIQDLRTRLGVPVLVDACSHPAESPPRPYQLLTLAAAIIVAAPAVLSVTGHIGPEVARSAYTALLASMLATAVWAVSSMAGSLRESPDPHATWRRDRARARLVIGLSAAILVANTIVHFF